MVLEQAKRTLEIESKAVAALIGRLDERFMQAVDLLYNCKGRVVVTGMGKSGLIGKKIVSTLSSTGSPAIFLHPAEGSHGDLGVVTRDDVILAISNSGETEELLTILPLIRRFNIKTIAMVGQLGSKLAKSCDVVLDVSVAEEACALGITPTASTTAALAMGDALAMALLKKRGFTKEDFAQLHPGGALGKKFLLRVDDLMHTGEEIPIAQENALLKDVIYEISSKTLGMTCVVDGEGVLEGIITDGDLRRLMERVEDPFSTVAKDFMSVNPKTIDRDELAVRALSVMEHYSITSLIIVDGDTKPAGVIHIHDLLKAGIA
jgi:arabinose-5-phosphate isomerase